jgi:hypothetical protein
MGNKVISSEMYFIILAGLAGFIVSEAYSLGRQDGAVILAPAASDPSDAKGDKSESKSDDKTGD